MKLLKTLVALLATATLVAACGGSDDNADDRADLNNPKVRFVNAVDAAPALTLYRDGQALSFARDFAFLDASPYDEVGGGQSDWRVAASQGEPTVGTVRFDPDRGDRYTLVALPAPGAGGAPSLILIEDPYNKGTSNDARVRWVNASPNRAAVDVYLSNSGDDDLSSLSPRFAGLAFGQVDPESEDDAIQVEGDTYRVSITAPGTKDVIFTKEVRLDNNVDWLMLTVPDGDTGLKVLVVKADGEGEVTEELRSDTD